jgi:seryl-tRNA synthetase
MLDIRLFRDQPDLVRDGLCKLGEDASIVDRVRQLDERVRALKTEAESQKAELNVASKAMGRATPEQREQLRAELRQKGDRIGELDAERGTVEAELDYIMLRVPNLPDPDVPVGPDDTHNTVARTVGEPRVFDFQPRPHWDLATDLGILDMERGVKVSGSRFYILKGLGAALQRALITWMLDLHIQRHGYTEVYPPFVVKEQCLVGTGNLPKFGENLYHDVEDDFWLVPTAEVPVTNIHRDEILPADQLPVKYVAYTPCFRREKMAAGRDVRGIKRGHQFDKVEMVKLCKPEESQAEFEGLLNNAEEVCIDLGIPYRVIQMCTGDLSFTAANKCDVEMWAPASKGEEGGEWLEVSSCSNFHDFQARRAGIRYRPEGGGKPEYVHTINGSGLALPRTMIAIMENYQNEDGSITIPEVLRPYLGGRAVITK